MNAQYFADVDVLKFLKGLLLLRHIRNVGGAFLYQEGASKILDYLLIILFVIVFLMCFMIKLILAGCPRLSFDSCIRCRKCCNRNIPAVVRVWKTDCLKK